MPHTCEALFMLSGIDLLVSKAWLSDTCNAYALGFVYVDSST
jgi:hypothetical protein